MPQFVVIFTGIVVFFQMLDVGLKVHPERFATLAKDTPLLFRSLLAALFVVPFVAFLVVWVFDLSLAVAYGLVLLAGASGAPLTTRRSEASGADLTYVSTLQVLLAACAVVVLPLTIAAFQNVLGSELPQVKPSKVATQVATVTFLPLILGLALKQFASNWLHSWGWIIAKVSRSLFLGFLIVVILALIFAADLRAKLLIGWDGFIAVLILAVSALAAGHLMGGPRSETRAGLAIASVARNLGLALYVAEASPQLAVAIPTILTYALVGFGVSFPYSRWAKGRHSFV